MTDRNPLTNKKCSTRAVAVAYANLAFVKYWGKLNPDLNIPANSSISMNLSNAKTVTEVYFSEDLDSDEVISEGRQVSKSSDFFQRIQKHLNRIRGLAGVSAFAVVKTSSSFPMSVGIASSASGFAALTLAGTKALGLSLSEKELSMLARLASGSACRSIPSGFVEWVAGDSHDNSFAMQIAPPEHWDIFDVAVIVSPSAKKVSSTFGHKLAMGSPFWGARQDTLQKRLARVRKAIIQRDFTTLGQEAEAESISLHVIALTSSYTEGNRWFSGIYYWAPETLELMTAVQDWRSRGLEVYFSLDAGPTVHLLCERENLNKVLQVVNEQKRDRNWTIIVNRPAPGAYIIE